MYLIIIANIGITLDLNFISSFLSSSSRMSHLRLTVLLPHWPQILIVYFSISGPFLQERASAVSLVYTTYDTYTIAEKFCERQFNRFMNLGHYV